MNRYQTESPSRPLALAAALALTVAMLAGVHAEAAPERAPTVLAAEFTGEVTPLGPVYRLPYLAVVARRSFELALPDLIDRAFGGALALGKSAKPNV